MLAWPSAADSDRGSVIVGAAVGNAARTVPGDPHAERAVQALVDLVHDQRAAPHPGAEVGVALLRRNPAEDSGGCGRRPIAPHSRRGRRRRRRPGRSTGPPATRCCGRRSCCGRCTRWSADTSDHPSETGRASRASCTGPVPALEGPVLQFGRGVPDRAAADTDHVLVLAGAQDQYQAVVLVLTQDEGVAPVVGVEAPAPERRARRAAWSSAPGRR
jgi:hypothetical protein